MPIIIQATNDTLQGLRAGMSRDELYSEAIRRHGRELARFMAGYEQDPARRDELLQDVHLALWQSFESFRGQCSMRTWAYRIAHNTGATHIDRRLRIAERNYLDLDDVDRNAVGDEGLDSVERHIDLERVFALIHRLAPIDREVMLLYLEDLDAASIGEITGLSARNIATKVHRIKRALALQLASGRTRP